MNLDIAALVSSGLWVGLVVALLLWQRGTISGLLRALTVRIREGARVSVGGFFELGETARPKLDKISPGQVIGASAEVVEAVNDEALSAGKYPGGFTGRVFVLHDWEVLQESRGRRTGKYVLHVWIEAYASADLADVISVTYRFPKTFIPNAVTQIASENQFDIWFKCWGEFAIVARLNMADGTQIFLNRHLTLPGRPEG